MKDKNKHDIDDVIEDDSIYKLFSIILIAVICILSLLVVVAGVSIWWMAGHWCIRLIFSTMFILVGIGLGLITLIEIFDLF